MAAVFTTIGVEVMSEKCCWANCDNPPGVGTHTQIEVPQIGTAPMVATLAVCEEHWYGNWRQLRAENGRLRELLHDIAVARRGNDGRVDELWDELPEEIEGMWAALAEADDRPWLCPNCGHPAARHFIGACPEYDDRPAPLTPRQRWGTCCPNDPKCEHSYMDSAELTRYMDTPLSDERPAT